MPSFASVSTVTVGEARVTYLADGGGRGVPTALFPDTGAESWSRHQEALDAEQRLVTSIGGFLVELGDRRVVVDTGIGPVRAELPGLGTFEGGTFLASLATAGIEPDAVTDVVFTHLHMDHCGWVTAPDSEPPRLTFAGARHHVAEAEWAHWDGKDDPAGPDRERVQAALREHRIPVRDGHAIAPGVSVMATPGHTPGHLSVVVDGGSDVRVVILGDLVYTPVQLAETSWRSVFDADPARARRTRERLLPQLEHPGTLIAAGHFADRVFGRLARVDGGLAWRPYGG